MIKLETTGTSLEQNSFFTTMECKKFPPKVFTEELKNETFRSGIEKLFNTIIHSFYCPVELNIKLQYIRNAKTGKFC